MLLPLARGFKTIPDGWDLPARTRFRDGEATSMVHTAQAAHRGTPAEKDSFASPFL